MQEYVINRPDAEVLHQILKKNFDNAVGAILRLAWQAGLLRDEIQRLTWAQIDFLDQKILLEDRTVPITEELTRWLSDLRDSRNRRSEFVVLSDRDQKQLTPQSISRLVRTELDREGQTSVRLIDLRHDFILRQLEVHDWQYVSRITGVEAAAMNVHFAEHLEKKRVSTRILREDPAQIDEFALWKLLQSERTTPAGLTLWLTWQLGLQLEEIVALTWSQVDLDRECLFLSERLVPLSTGVLGILKEMRPEQTEGFVLRSSRTGQPYDRTRLSKLVRAALIRSGMDNVTLRDLRMDCNIRVGGETQVMTYLRKEKSITRNEAAKLLQVSGNVAYTRLKQMVKRGKLTQIGSRYYLKDAVVSPEKQEAVILSYLEQEGFAYRQDIARILGIDATQCRGILQRLVSDGKIEQQRQRYILKSEEQLQA